jgi:integrase
MNQVEAVKNKKQRDQVEAHLQQAGRIYYDIWKLGLNTALRISDLLALTMADVKRLDAKSPVLDLKEIKTGKSRRIVINKTAFQIMQKRLADYPKAKYLFQSEAVNIDRRRKQPISRRSAARVFEKIGQRVAPKVQLSTHSMRKTRGYAMFDAGKSIESICKVLNHSTPAVTMRYIGIDQHDIDQSYVDFEL